MRWPRLPPSAAIVRARPGRVDGDRGMVATELAIVTPALLALMMLATFGSRIVWAERQIQAASAAAARAASQQGTFGSAQLVAAEVAEDNLDDAGVSCSGGPAIVTTADNFAAGGSVEVEVRCTTDVSDLAFVNVPGSYSFGHSSTEVIDELRGGS